MVAREGERRHDPLEGVSVTGLITTGVSRGRVPVDFEPILAAALDVLGAVDERVAVYLYGAVATGQAYHFKVERADGKTVQVSVNGAVYFELADREPLAGAGHEHFGFNDWDAPVCFDKGER